MICTMACCAISAARSRDDQREPVEHSVTEQRPGVVVGFEANEEIRGVIARALGDVALIRYVHGAGPAERRAALETARALLTWRPHLELDDAERANLGRLGFIQCAAAGIDFVPFDKLPVGVPFACNAGAFSGAMAEHVMAMVLAAAKALSDRYERLKRGDFAQFAPTKTLDGATCAILGYGGIGQALANLLRPFGARVHAINRSGKTDDPVDFVGTLADLDRVLKAADVLVLTLSLNKATRGLIGARELDLMKRDAILVNVARGPLIDQAALYAHLVAHPGFTACLDAWWVEPFVHGRFHLDHPFFDLPNFLGSPHNSAVVPGSIAHAIEAAALNVRRFLMGEPPLHVVGEADRA